VVKGSLAPPVLEGRLPANPNEIALGSSTLRGTGLGIGDTVPVAPPGGEPKELEIVGEVVGSQLTNLPDSGVVAVITPDAAMQLAGVETTSQLNDAGFDGNVVITYRPGTDEGAMESRLRDAYTLDFPAYSHPKAPGRLLNIDAMRRLVVGLLGFCAFLAAVALAHALMVSTKRRRHEFSVLSALGLFRRQIRSVVWVQALTLTALGVLVGVPIGIVIGRVAWRAAISDVGMVVATTTPLLPLSTVVLGALAVGWLISLLPGARAGRTRPATELRAE
jgi:ABC-type antimicrobial peptide transport system permease subunit